MAKDERMTLGEIIEALHNVDGVSFDEAKNMGVEFCTIDGCGMSLLSAYREGDSIIIDVGTEEDNDKHNKEVAEFTKGMGW
jgi:polygalacturonase